MANEAVKLLGVWSSPFVRRVEWALKLKEVKFQLLEDDIYNKSPLLLKSNPLFKRVPVLIHGGKPICESLAIIEYIDETWPQSPLLPEDPYEKARARLWAKFVEDKLTECLRSISISEGEEQIIFVEQFAEMMQIIEEEAKKKEGKFFGGDSIGLLDLVLGWTVIWMESVEEVACGCEKKLFDPLKFPCFSKWMDNFQELPLIKENLPAKDKLLGYVRRKRVRLGLTQIK